MNNRPIVINGLKRTNTPVLTENISKFKPRKGFIGILQHIAWNFLNDTSSIINHIDYETTFERYVINKQAIRDKILNSFFESFPYANPTKIYIGPKEFDEIIYDQRNIDIIDMFSFRVDEEIWTSYNDSMGIRKHHKQMLGLDVYVVPHMEGVLVV